LCLAVLNFAPPVSTIFFDPAKISVDALNDRCKGTMNEALGIEYTALGDNWLEAKMPVNANTIQPLKMLNGGASLALIEILGSMAANLVLDRNRFVALGQAVTCNHLKPANMGEEITARATPLHLGRTSQVWEVVLTSNTGKMVCKGNITMAVVALEKQGA
jgi:1,4-dihydroxy-2-naphthoyl-CoA hydrolase